MDEQLARQLPVCPGCGVNKHSGPGGCIVCWDCFKNEVNGRPPFKYFNGTLSEWLALPEATTK